MRHIRFLMIAIGALSLVSIHAYAADLKADSRITRVTLYPDSALVTRTAGLAVDRGGQQVLFADIIPQIDESSLKVSGSGTAQVKILGAEVKKEFLSDTASEKSRQLQDALQKLNDEKRTLTDSRKSLEEVKNFLDSIRLSAQKQIPKDLVTKLPSTKDLDDLAAFLAVRFKDYYTQVFEAEVKERDIDKKIEALRRELAELSNDAGKMRRHILVDLDAAKAGNCEISISYLVYGAQWRPLYDARADFEKMNVEMTGNALVSQKTGEDWTDVEMSLSTARPAVGGRLSAINPWVLRPYARAVPAAALQQESRRALSLNRAKAASYAEGDAAAGAGKVEEYEPVIEEKGIAVVYTLPRKASVKSDGSQSKLPVVSQDLKVDFTYSTYPRFAPVAYLGSRVTNAPNLQLPGGPVHIFLDGDFVGSSGIDSVGPGEKFDLYLGADENVKVKREQIEKKVDETLIAGIPSPTKRTTLKYKITVENYKSRAINVKLFDSIPVSEEDRIKVKINNISPEPNVRDWQDKKGVWLWELALDPKAKKEVTYTCIIEHPRDMQVEGL